MTGRVLFATVIGRCGVAWRNDRLAGVALPGSDDDATLATLGGHAPDAVSIEPPAIVTAWIDEITAHLGGRLSSLHGIPLDIDRVTAKRARIYAATRQITPGRVVTYGELAGQVGTIARAIGQAMARNPWPLVVPCHRVVAANARLGGFSAPGGLATKRRLLELERAALPGAAMPELFAPSFGASPLLSRN